MTGNGTSEGRGRVVLVTGGSRGLGRAIVGRLAAQGYVVGFTYRTELAAANGLAEEISALGGRAMAFALDLGDRSRADDLIPEVEAALGPIYGVVNNAGFRKESLLAMTPDEDWDAVLDVNLGGAFRIARAALRGLVSRRSGSIVNVASLSALHGVAGQGAYAAAKAGLLGMTRALAREVGKRNVRANGVVPGFVATDLTADLPPDRVAFLRAGECLPNGVLADSVAAAVEFLLSEGAASITGQTLVVDAGASA